MLSAATLSEIAVIVSLIVVIVTLVTFVLSQRNTINSIQSTVIDIKTENADFHSQVNISLTKNDLSAAIIAREHNEQTKMMSSLVISHSNTKISMEFMQKMFDTMSGTMNEVSKSISQLSIVMNNQVKVTNELILTMRQNN